MNDGPFDGLPPAAKRARMDDRPNIPEIPDTDSVLPPIPPLTLIPTATANLSPPPTTEDQDMPSIPPIPSGLPKLNLSVIQQPIEAPNRNRAITNTQYADKIFQKILSLEPIQQGTYGRVYRIENNIVKAINIHDPDIARKVDNEIRILKYLKPHCQDFILCIKRAVRNDTTGEYYIITEYGGKDMFDVVNQEVLNENKMDSIIRNICVGLKKIHDLNVVHRDIKLENILINYETNKIKYIDFGESCFVGECSNIPVGTVNYIAPELVSNYQQDYDPRKNDIYSLGVVISVILHRDMLSREDMIERSGKYQTLLRNMLEQEPNQRWDINQVLDEVNSLLTGR